MLEIEKFDRENLVDRLHYPFNRDYVVEAFEHLVKELGPVIHKYDTIVGDDVSGRLPTLVVADLARKKRAKMDLTPPQVFFISAGSNISRPYKAPETLPKIRGLINKHRGEDRRVLLVTEYVSTGNSISTLARELTKQDFKPDLCILSSMLEPIYINLLTDYKIFFGDRIGGGTFHDYPEFTGLSKVDCSPVAVRRDFYYLDRNKAHEARQDMKLLANELWKLIE